MILPIGDENEAKGRPYLTYALIAVNVAVFLYEATLTPEQDLQFTRHYASYPDHFRWLTALTSTFMHGNLPHILGNMIYLYIYGDNVEDRLGRIPYLLFYLGTGVFASFCHAHAVAEGFRNIPSVGASGSISALLGAYMVLFPWAKIKYLVFFWLIVPYYRVFYVWSWVTVGFWFLGQALAQGLATSQGVMDGVAYAAHVGGFLVGVVVTLGATAAGLVEADWSGLRSTERRAPAPTADARVASAPPAMPCPACEQGLRPLPLPHFTPHECRACGGLWCDAGQAQALLAVRHLPESILSPPAQHPSLRLVPAGERHCPRCQQQLQTQEVDGVELDTCAQCQGVFLQRGELGALHRARHS